MSKVPTSNSAPNEKSVKRAAKELSRSTGISYCKALDQIAKNHKFLDYHHLQKAHAGFFDSETTVFWFTVPQDSEFIFEEPHNLQDYGITEDMVFYRFVLRDYFSLRKKVMSKEERDKEPEVDEMVRYISSMEETRCFRCMIDNKMSPEDMARLIFEHFDSAEELFFNNMVQLFEGKKLAGSAQTYKDWLKTSVAPFISGASNNAGRE